MGLQKNIFEHFPCQETHKSASKNLGAQIDLEPFQIAIPWPGAQNISEWIFHASRVESTQCFSTWHECLSCGHWPVAHMHLLACVPNYTLKRDFEINPHAANLRRLPNSPASKVPNGLLVTYSRHYSSAQTESRYCCQRRRIVPKRVLQGRPYLLDKHSSATKGILWHRNHQFRKGRAAGASTRITLTQDQEPCMARLRSSRFFKQNIATLCRLPWLFQHKYLLFSWTC